MKYLLSTLFLICGFYVIPTYSQDPRQNEIKALHLQIPPLVAAEKFDELVPIARRIVELEKEGGRENIKNYLFALQNLARWMDRRIDLFIQGKKSGITNYYEGIIQVTDLYKELLELAQKAGTPLHRAAIQSDAAYFYYHHRISFPTAIDLYKQSLSTREKLLPPDADATLVTMEKLSELYFLIGNFEEFLPLNRHLLTALEQKSDDSSKGIRIFSLTLYARLLTIIDRVSDAKLIDEQIGAITGKPFVTAEDAVPVLNRGLSKIKLEFGKVPFSPMSGGVVSTPNPTTMRIREESIAFRGGSVVTVPRHTVADSMVIPQTSVRNQPGKAQAIDVSILIDEKGNVVEVVPDTTETKWVKKIIEGVSKWKFRPFSYNDTPVKMRGRVVVVYYK